MHDPEAFLEARAGSPPVSSAFITQLLESLSWRPKPRILDYGCGPGTICHSFIVPYAEKWDGHVVGVDVSSEMVQTAVDKSAHPRVEYHQANLFASDSAVCRSSGSDEVLAPRSYDVIICNLVLHFLKPHKPAVARLGELLKPGGQLGFVNMSNSPHYALLQELAAEPRFKPYMDANEWQRYLPEWIELDVDFMEDLQASGLPPWLKIVSMDKKRVTYDLPLETLVTLMYSVGPLAGRLADKALEEEVKAWYRQRVRSLYNMGEEDNEMVKGHWVEAVVGVLQRESES